MRLIDADALIRVLEHSSETWAKNIPSIRNWWPHAVRIKDNIVALIKDAPTIDPTPQWIPVTERLPERDKKCLCRYTFGEKEIMCFYQVLDYYATDPQPHFQHTLGDNGMRVTHWMPLPKPPEDGGKEK